MKEKLIAQIKAFLPCNAQEEADKQLMLQLLQTPEDLTLRSCLQYHLTASAWVVDPRRTRVLMAYHNLYDSWAWLGGHADGDWDLQAVARKEAREESGIEMLKDAGDFPVSLEILTVSGHEKKGKYVPSHLHLNLTYLFEADPDAPLRARPEENSAVDWIAFEDLPERSSEPWFVERIYRKLAEKSRL